MSPEKVPWYRVAFGPLYKAIYPHRTDEAAEREVTFVLSRIPLATGSRVLDLACGNGRHLRALVRRGHHAIGLDLSLELLHSAARRGFRRLVRGDMRHLPFGECVFAAVFSFFTSFGYFESVEEDVAVLKEVQRVLDQRGTFFLDFLNADAVGDTLVPRSERTLGHKQIIEERRIEGNRVLKHVRVVGPTGEIFLDYEESVRLYRLEDIRKLLATAGLEFMEAFGSFDGHPVGQGTRLVVFARKP